MRNRILQRYIIVGILFTVLALAGCGVKGPPVPPKSPPVPQVTDLVHRLDGSTAILEWSLAKGLSGKQARKASFGIYRSRTPLSEPVCETCPLIFDKIETVAYLPADDGRFSTIVALESGYRYVFAVRMEVGGHMGNDSNRARFDFP